MIMCVYICRYIYIYICIYIYMYGTPPVIYLFWGRLRKCLGLGAEVGQSAVFSV